MGRPGDQNELNYFLNKFGSQFFGASSTTYSGLYTLTTFSDFTFLCFFPQVNSLDQAFPTSEKLSFWLLARLGDSWIKDTSAGPWWNQPHGSEDQPAVCDPESHLQPDYETGEDTGIMENILSKSCNKDDGS